MNSILTEQSPEFIKVQHAVDRDYSYYILSHDRIDLGTLHHVRIDVHCILCDMEGQYWWQSKDKSRLVFYCPSCNITWSVFKKEAK